MGYSKEEVDMKALERGPEIRCGQITTELNSWEDVAKGFSSVKPVIMRQHWRDTPEDDFRPATVRTGWTGQRLWVYAVLEDVDAFNPVTAFNEPAYEFGDVFEIFIKPGGQTTYYEFHVSPVNQLFQLRIPSVEAFQTLKTGPGIPEPLFLRDWQIESRVLCEPERQRWSVLATLPLDRMAENGPVNAGDEWLYSFSRYDYTRGRSAPVLSSTSPHTVLSYHRQQEWGRFLFV